MAPMEGDPSGFIQIYYSYLEKMVIATLILFLK